MTPQHNMPRLKSIYKLFLASPSDVVEERAIVKNIIDEFNSIYSDRLNAMIELCSWEKSSYPSCGADAQEVINSQIGDNYDIFLGILWTRFGSKTQKYESGTEEEFYRAYERFKRGEHIHIMMYFNHEKVSPDSLDLEQYSKIKNFKQKIAEIGCYYFTYTGKESFKDELRSHLYKVITNWHNDDTEPVQEEAKASTVAIPLENTSELGLIELQDIIDTQTAEAVKALKEIQISTEWISRQITKHTLDLTNINAKKSANQIQLAKNIINSSAKDMNLYAKRLDQPIQDWLAFFREAIKATKEMLQISDYVIKRETWIENKTSLNLLFTTLDGSYSQIIAFHNTVRATPKMTQALIAAQKNVCVKLKSLLDCIDKGKKDLLETIDLINKKLLDMVN